MLSAGIAKFQHFLWIVVFLLVMVRVTCSLKEQNYALRKLFSLSAEDFRFASSRCLNDSQIDSSILKMQWFQMIFPDNNETHCYIKCFLGRLGLINLRTRGIDVEKLYTIWQNINEISDDACFENVVWCKELDGTCSSYYKAWISLWEYCDSLMKHFFFNNSEIRSKAFGETATEFCYLFVYKKGSLSRYEPTILDLYKLNLVCIFRHFHYFDAYGRVDPYEIQKSFDDAQVLTPSNIAITHHCSRSANALFSNGLYEVAYELNKCLTENSADFMEVYSLRNNSTRGF